MRLLAVCFLQGAYHAFFVCRIIFPYVRLDRIRHGAGVRHIEDVTHARLVILFGDKRNARRAGFDVSQHALIPKVEGGTGSCFRALRVDHHGILKRILIGSRGRVQKTSPFFWGSSQLFERFRVKLTEMLKFYVSPPFCHNLSLPSIQKMSSCTFFKRSSVDVAQSRAIS